MRISYWISDGCSSDLALCVRPLRRLRPYRLCNAAFNPELRGLFRKYLFVEIDVLRNHYVGAITTDRRLSRALAHLLAEFLVNEQARGVHSHLVDFEIGRAAWWERVWR